LNLSLLLRGEWFRVQINIETVQPHIINQFRKAETEQPDKD